jgi:AmmeMemoRadiSam system protein A
MTLLRIAREAITSISSKQQIPELNLEELPAPLADHGASFVTLTLDTQLRGCIGSLTPENRLAHDVQLHAVAAAKEDFRFLPIDPQELGGLEIEISVLSEPHRLDSSSAAEFLKKISPRKDGVTLVSGTHRATFLPQVWENIPNPVDFMQKLCEKANLPQDAWKGPDVVISTYQVVSFRESDFRELPSDSAS